MTALLGRLNFLVGSGMTIGVRSARGRCFQSLEKDACHLGTDGDSPEMSECL